MKFCELCGEFVELESTDEDICLSCLDTEGYGDYEELDFSEHHSFLKNEVKEEVLEEDSEELNVEKAV